MNRQRLRLSAAIACLVMLSVPGMAPADAPLSLEGLVVTPHVRAARMIYNEQRPLDIACRVECIFVNAGSEPVVVSRATFNGQTPDELRRSGAWAWHGISPEMLATPIPPGARVLWSFNGRSSAWGLGRPMNIQLETSAGPYSFETTLADPPHWLAAITYVGSPSQVQPTQLVAHLRSAKETTTIGELKLRAPRSPETWWIFDRTIEPSGKPTLAGDATLSPEEPAILTASFEPLPLTYGLVEIKLTTADNATQSVWGHTRIKRETFDISGGWVSNGTQVGNSLTYEPFLRALRWMHVNTGHIADSPSYSDQTGPDGLYTRYPLKYFNRLEPAQYDNDATLPRIHAAEWLGEPQYPNPENNESPQRVRDEVSAYASSRIPTSVTLSDESTWRLYAGLSDFPHYDAYRVVAPHVDAWHKYSRWGGKKIYWGSPLETIGDLSRSLRDLSRPAPTAYWAQGPHHGWDNFDGRRRRSPTPDEIRLQAYHALATRITSLYWFNLSPKSLVKFRDTLDELRRVGREIKMLEPFYLEGSALHFETVHANADRMGWDLHTLIAPSAVLLFALDNEYSVDTKERVFSFPPPREVLFDFPLPPSRRSGMVVLRVDADGVHDVPFEKTSRGVSIRDTRSRVGIYVVASQESVRSAVAARHAELVQQEQSLQFDPSASDADFAQLEKMVKK
jgi:hypothetical protein